MALGNMKMDDVGAEEVILARCLALSSFLDKWYKRTGEFWKQHSREIFLHDMDRNSKYFHMVANMKRRKKYLQFAY